MGNMTIGTWGRILLGLVFLVSGIFHFVDFTTVAGTLPGFVPLGTLWATLIGLAMVLAGLSMLTRRYVRAMGIVLAVTLGVVVLLIHLPALPSSLGFFLRDIGLLAATLLIVSNYPHHDNE